MGDSSSAPSAPAFTEREVPEGHVYELARRLSEEEKSREKARARRFAEGKEAPHEPFPDALFRIPVPNEVFRKLPSLSGAEVRGALLLIRAAFRYDPKRGWSASPRYFTASELADVPSAQPGLSKKSIVRAMRALERLGWAEVKEGPQGTPHRFRCLLSAPSRGFTWLPAALFEAHGRLPSAALQVLLCIYRETWGWTRREARKGGETLAHKVRAPLSNEELATEAGLHVSTVRRGVKDLLGLGLIERGRPHQASPFFYRATEPEPAPHRDKLHTPTSKGENLTHRQAPARGNRHPSPAPNSNNRGLDEPTKGRREGRKSGRNRPDRPSSPPSPEPEELSSRERELYRTLTGDGIGLDPEVAARQVWRLAPDVVERTIDRFLEKQEQIENPGGWMRVALEDVHCNRETTEPPPSRRRKQPQKKRRGATEEPLGKLFEEPIGENQGGEDDFTGDFTGESGEASPKAEGESPTGAANRPAGGPENRRNRPEIGLSHREMCELVDALGTSTDRFEQVEREGQKPLWVPTKELGNWAWRRRNQGGESFQNAAERVVQLRKRYESQ